jgi:hypothetical protein
MGIIHNMYVSRMCNIMQENAKKSKMLALFNTLGEHDKDIVIAMTESLVERSKDINTADIKTASVVANRRLTMRAH